MKSLTIVCFVVATLFSGSLQANTDTGPVKIEYLINWVGSKANPNESLYVKTNQTVKTNPANCSYTGDYKLEHSSVVGRSLLMTAITTKSDVRLTISGDVCSSSNRAVIVAIRLLD